MIVGSIAGWLVGWLVIDWLLVVGLHVGGGVDGLW